MLQKRRQVKRNETNFDIMNSMITNCSVFSSRHVRVHITCAMLCQTITWTRAIRMARAKATGARSHGEDSHQPSACHTDALRQGVSALVRDPRATLAQSLCCFVWRRAVFCVNGASQCLLQEAAKGPNSDSLEPAPAGGSLAMRCFPGPQICMRSAELGSFVWKRVKF